MEKAGCGNVEEPRCTRTSVGGRSAEQRVKVRGGAACEPKQKESSRLRLEGEGGGGGRGWVGSGTYSNIHRNERRTATEITALRTRRGSNKFAKRTACTPPPPPRPPLATDHHATLSLDDATDEQRRGHAPTRRFSLPTPADDCGDQARPGTRHTK